MKIKQEKFAAFIFALICCSGFSFLMPYRIYMIIAFTIVMLRMDIRNGKIRIYKDGLTIMYMLLITYILVSIMYSYCPIETIKFLVTYLAGATIIILPVSKEFYKYFIVYVEKLTRLVSISILVQLFVPRIYMDYLYFFIRGGASSRTRLSKEVSNHIFSGIVGEKGEAAFLMVIAIVIVFAKCVYEKKVSRKNLFWLCLHMIALLLPAKRMLFAIGLAICMGYIILWTKGNKKIIAIGGVEQLLL